MEVKNSNSNDNTPLNPDDILNEINDVLSASAFKPQDSDESSVKMAEKEPSAAQQARMNSFEELEALLATEIKATTKDDDIKVAKPQPSSKIAPSAHAFDQRTEIEVKKTTLDGERINTKEFVKSENRPISAPIKEAPDSESIGDTKAMPAAKPSARKYADEKISKQIDEAIKIKKLGEAVGNAEDVQQVSAEDAERAKQEQDEFEFKVAFGMDKVSDADLESFTRYDDYGNKITGKEEHVLTKKQRGNTRFKREFTSYEQTRQIFDTYRNRNFALNLKLLIGAILLFFSLYLELAPALGWSLPSYMDIEAYNVVYILIDVQLLLLGAWLVGSRIVEGLTSLIRLEPNISSITFLALLISGLHAGATYHLKLNQADFRLYCSIGVMCVMLQLVYDHIALKKELYSFNVVSSKKNKFLVTPLEDRKLDREMFADQIPENGEYYTIDRTPFVSGFFARATAPVDGALALKYIIPAVLFVGISLLCVMLALKKELYPVLSSVTAVILAGLPASAYLSVMLPLYTSSRNAFKHKSAIIGDAGLTEYVSPSLLALEDTDIFNPAATQLSSFKSYGNNIFMDVVFTLSKVFEKLGGPLSKVFTSILSENIQSNNAIVRFNEISENGLDVLVNGKEVLIGRKSYFKNLGYATPYDDPDATFEKSSGCIMYVTINGNFAAKVYIKYQLDRTFEESLRSLARSGISVSIHSKDPNINENMLKKFMRIDNFSIKVLKTLTDVTPEKPQVSSSGIVSRESVSSLIKALIICSKINKAVKRNGVIKNLSAIIGCALVILLSVFGTLGAVSTGLILVLQLVCLLPVLAMSNINQ